MFQLTNELLTVLFLYLRMALKENLEEFWYQEQVSLIKNHPVIYKYTDAGTGLKILENSSLAFRNPMYFNDPYDFSFKLLDFSPTSENTVKDILFETYNHLNRQDRKVLWQTSKKKLMKTFHIEVEQLMREDIQHHGVTCFSEVYDQMLMWSHYAKSHSGICLGFDLVELFYEISQNTHPERMVRKVVYQDKISPIKYLEARQEATIRWMTTKSAMWEYEKEIRITLTFLDLNEDQLNFQKISKESFNSVYLGSQIHPDDEESVRNICMTTYPKIKIYKMSLADDEFRLISVEN